MDWTQTLVNAGLPCKHAETNPETGQVDAEFERGLTSAEWQTYLNIIDPAAARKAASENGAYLSTELRTVTGEQAVAWIENNVTTLATAKTALKILTRMVIALRDATWPNLPDLPDKK